MEKSVNVITSADFMARFCCNLHLPSAIQVRVIFPRYQLIKLIQPEVLKYGSWLIENC